MLKFEAPRPCDLANSNLENTLGLPPGRLVHPHADMAGKASDTPVMWISRTVLGDAGRRASELRRQFSSTGLWPLVLETLSGAPTRPWDDGELDPSASSSSRNVDVAATLAGWWESSVPTGEMELAESLAPLGLAFPGMAPATSGPVDESALDAVTGTPWGGAARILALLVRSGGRKGRLGLVPVTHPADVVAAIGWLGPCNCINDMGLLAAVLRSWSERFGAEPVVLGFDTLTLAVRRPPTTRDEALAIAAEHVAVCPDNLFQGVGDLDAYAHALIGQKRWDFWWD